MKFSDLPRDVEREILSRVPTKSLAKLKTTCKRWYTLFKDPRFIKKNLGKSAKEVILLMNSRVHSISLNLHGIHNNSVDPSIIKFTGKLSRRLKDSKNIKISQIFHCEGLILCSTKGNEKRLVVWNPCTGETWWIKPSDRYKKLEKYVLGYGNNNYKILRYNFHINIELKLAEFEIYDFNSKSWRVLDGITHKWGLLSPAVSLKGNTYWVAFDNHDEDSFNHILLTFDFTTEIFGCRPLPYQNDDPESNACLSVVREEKLAVLYCDYSFDKVKIWVTNTKIDEDTKDLSWINFLVVKCMPSCVMSFLVDEENKMAVCCDIKKTTTIYVVGEDIDREVYKDAKECFFNWPFLVSYVPSLVQIQKRKTTKGKRKRSKIGA